MFYFQRIYIFEVSDRIMNHWWLFILITTVVVLSGVIYQIRQEEEKQYSLQRQKFDLLESNYQVLMQAYEEKSVLLHDLNKYVSIIREIAITREIGDGQKQLLDVAENMRRSWNRNRLENFCNHELLNLILYQKMEEAKNAEIRIQYEFDDMSDLQMIDADICALFVNLLDNAIEANQRKGKGEKRWIEFACYRKASQLIIFTSNPVAKFQNEKQTSLFVTTKSDRVFHGFGMRSIRQVIEDYSGYMEVYVCNNVFKLSAYLKGFNT